MTVRTISVTVHECDGCGSKQYLEDASKSRGIFGAITETNDMGSFYAEYYACKPECHAKAVENAKEPEGM